MSAADCQVVGLVKDSLVEDLSWPEFIEQFGDVLGEAPSENRSRGCCSMERREVFPFRFLYFRSNPHLVMRLLYILVLKYINADHNYWSGLHT